jgi:hypothetical protein
VIDGARVLVGVGVDMNAKSRTGVTRSLN